METQILPASNPKALLAAEALLRAGEPVAFPTDTVYGLGAWLWEAQAVERLFQVKGRDAAKAIAVLVGDATALPNVAAAMGPLAERLAKRFWPGPLTLVVPGHPALPPNLSPLPTVGVRMPDHPAALALLRRTGPLAVTSANLSDRPSTISAEEVLAQLGSRIPLILDGGRVPGGLPSTVVDCTGADLVVLRAGPLTEEQLRQALSGSLS
jgi:L-threonylcarbamoyladenylate synthase